MAAPKRAPVTTHDLQGFKYFRVLGPLLDHLHAAGTKRGRASNRQLFYDQYATWLLWYFLSPIVTSLRGLRQATTLAQVHARFGLRPTALGTLSEAAQVCDAALRQEVMAALGRRIPPPAVATERAALQALPKMAWALWQDAQHRAAKRHVAFEVYRQIPVGITVTAGQASEPVEWRHMGQPGGFYVVDRGSTDDELFQERHDLPCPCLARVQHHAAYEVQEERPLSAAAQAAGGRRDPVARRADATEDWRPGLAAAAVALMFAGPRRTPPSATRPTPASEGQVWPADGSPPVPTTAATARGRMITLHLAPLRMGGESEAIPHTQTSRSMACNGSVANITGDLPSRSEVPLYVILNLFLADELLKTAHLPRWIFV